MLAMSQQPLHHPWMRGSAGSQAEELLAALQGHISHLKPDLALRVAIFLLPDAESLLGAPSALPQRISSAIQELAAATALHPGPPAPWAPAAAAPISAPSCPKDSAGLYAPLAATPFDAYATVHVPVREVPARRRSCKALRGQHSGRGTSLKGLASDGQELRTCLSTPPPREDGGDNFYNFQPKQVPVQSTTIPTPAETQAPKPSRLHIPKAVHIGKRHSEPIPALLENSRRRLRDHDGGNGGATHVNSRLRSPSGAAIPPTQSLVPVPQTAAPAPGPQLQRVPRPPPLQMPIRHRPTDAFLYRDAQPSPSSRFTASSDSETSSEEDEEDVGKAVARVVKQQLAGMPALADALVRLMTHDGMCSSQELLKVAAGGRGSSTLDSVAAAAINRVMEHQAWIENLPSDSPTTPPVAGPGHDGHDATRLQFAYAMRITRSKSADTLCSTSQPNGGTATGYWSAEPGGAPQPVPPQGHPACITNPWVPNQQIMGWSQPPVGFNLSSQRPVAPGSFPGGTHMCMHPF